MLTIEINDKVEEFNQFHFDKIENLISIKITETLLSLEPNESSVLTWIMNNLETLLKGKIDELRSKINEFNTLINGQHLTREVLTIAEFKDNATVDELKNVCRESEIIGFSSLNKSDLINHILRHQNNLNIEEETYRRIKIKQLFSKCKLDKIFEEFYEKEWDKIVDYDRYNFVYKHDLRTCPYCNRNYIFTLRNGKVRPEIDHFYPKSIYPYLSMSFYNLIPSCQICNHTKKAKDSFKDDLKSPYEITSNNFKFTYKPSNVDFLQERRNKFDFKKIKVKLKNKIEINDAYFKLEKLYRKHTDVVLELIIKRFHYPPSYLKELEKEYGLRKDEIYRLLMCSYKNSDEFHKRPLSKLIKDISEELDLI